MIDSRIDGRVTIMEDTKVVNSTIRGPCIIGRNCLIENSYVGPYTSIGDNTKIIGSSIEYSIVLKGATIEGIDRLEESLIGENAKLIKASKRKVIKAPRRRFFRNNTLNSLFLARLQARFSYKGALRITNSF